MAVSSTQAVIAGYSTPEQSNNIASPSATGQWQSLLAHQQTQQSELPSGTTAEQPVEQTEKITQIPETLSVDSDGVKLNIHPETKVSHIELLVEQYNQDINQVNILLHPEQGLPNQLYLAGRISMDGAGVAALKSQIQKSGIAELADGSKVNIAIKSVLAPDPSTALVSKDSDFYQQATNAIAASREAINAHAETHKLKPVVSLDSVNYSIEHHPALAGKYHDSLSQISLYKTADQNLKLDTLSVAVHEYGHHLMYKSGLYDAVEKVLPGHMRNSNLISEGVAELYLQDVLPKADFSPAYAGYLDFMTERVIPALPAGMQTFRQALVEGDSKAQQVFANTIKEQLDVYQTSIDKELALMAADAKQSGKISVNELGREIYQLPQGQVMYGNLFELLLDVAPHDKQTPVELTVNTTELDENVLASNLLRMHNDSKSLTVSNNKNYQMIYKLTSGYDFIVNADGIKLAKDGELLGELKKDQDVSGSKHMMQYFINKASAQYPDLLNGQ